jgi:hypothetical protein
MVVKEVDILLLPGLASFRIGVNRESLRPFGRYKNVKRIKTSMETLATLKVSIVLALKFFNGAERENHGEGGRTVPAVRHPVCFDG